MTELEQARIGNITEAIRRVAEKEDLPPETVRQGVEQGTIVITKNIGHRNLDPIGIGKGLKTKINANIGTSMDRPTLEEELKKLAYAIAAGADTIMDLSTGGDIRGIRRNILARADIPLGTVPIYQTAIEARDIHGYITAMSVDDMFRVIEEQAEEGVDFMTIHCGLTRAALDRLKAGKRVTDIVSRGGAFMMAWMLHHDRENPFYEHFNRLLEIARKYDVTLSLGDAMRPGCLADATDGPQIQELLTLGELVTIAWDAGVQVMIEGPGHVPMDQIEANVKLQKQVCKGAPFYVLGPLVTDVAPGYDHITGAIGGAIAAAAGADFLCYVTPAEHLGLPSVDDVKEGVIASRIAAHAADLVKGVKGAWEQDRSLALARKALNWDEQQRFALDPTKFDKPGVQGRRSRTGEACSMCGDFCAMKLVADHLGGTYEKC